MLYVCTYVLGMCVSRYSVSEIVYLSLCVVRVREREIVCVARNYLFTSDCVRKREGKARE